MAPPKNLQLIPNEYYELKNYFEINPHPHIPLMDFKFVMFEETSVPESVLFKWPSFKSLALFINDSLDVLPTFDEYHPFTPFDAIRMVERPADLVALCSTRGLSPKTWLHDYALHKLGEVSSGMITTARPNHIRTDHFYTFSSDDFPRDTVYPIAGFPRVAWVSRQYESQDVGYPTVEVRLPSMASLDEFQQSQSGAFPAFPQVFRISIESARGCLKRILPIQLCFRLRKRRDFWMGTHQDRLRLTLRTGGTVFEVLTH